VHHVPDAADRYLAHVAPMARGRLSGWRVVVDCANGATSRIAPALWERLGATVIPVNAEPDGTNINAGSGSTHPEVIQAAVVAHGADLGFAHDGDGDRVIAADRHGHLVDGDTIMGITALHRHARGELPGALVVATVMSNLGFEQVLHRAGIRLERVRVGDRYVLERMLETGARVGGEQSGHVLILDRATPGDGLVTAVELVNVILESGRPLEDLRAPFHRYPQVLLNVRVPDPGRWANDPEIAAAVAQAERRLRGRGRVLIRASGTEPLVRVMTECDDGETADVIARELSDLIGRRLGASVAQVSPAAPDADLVLACGPNRMLAAVAARWPEAQVAVETYMGCGTGVCLGCAVPLARGGFDRACKEGPVYRAADVEWAALPSHLAYAVTA